MTADALELLTSISSEITLRLFELIFASIKPSEITFHAMPCIFITIAIAGSTSLRYAIQLITAANLVCRKRKVREYNVLV